MANMVWTVLDSVSKQPIVSAQVTGNYSSGPSPGWFNSCSTGPGSPVNGYTNGSGQYVTTIPYTCGGGNYTVTVSASGYNSQSVTTPLGTITGDVYQDVFMVQGIGFGGPPGQGIGASLTSTLNTGSQAWGEYAIIGVIVVVVVLIIVVVLAKEG